MRDPVEFAAYLFYRYAADHPIVLADPHLADARGRGDRALDAWGEVRTPEAMAAMADGVPRPLGVPRLQAQGRACSPPTSSARRSPRWPTRLGPGALLRIDPNGRWKVETAIRIGKAIAGLPLEYYEDPVQRPGGDGRGPQGDRPEDEHEHVRDPVRRTSPEALRVQPIDVLLCDLHYFGGFAGCLALGPVCDAAGWTMSQHSNNHAGLTMAAMIHLAAAIPQLTIGQRHPLPLARRRRRHHRGPEAARSGRHDGRPRRARASASRSTATSSPAPTRSTSSAACRRDDAPLMRKLEPGWTGGLL